MVVIVEKVLANKLINKHILIREIRLFDASIIESIEDRCSDFSPYFGESAIFLKSFLEGLFELGDAGHLNEIS